MIKLRLLRLNAGYTAKQVAAECGIGAPFLSKIETGKYPRITTKAMAGFRRLFGRHWTPEALLTEANPLGPSLTWDRYLFDTLWDAKIELIRALNGQSHPLLDTIEHHMDEMESCCLDDACRRSPQVSRLEDSQKPKRNSGTSAWGVTR